MSDIFSPRPGQAALRRNNNPFSAQNIASKSATNHVLGEYQPAPIVPPVGVPQPFLGAAAPTGWHICDGSAVSRSLNPRLYSVLGTTYGAGDGSTTFNLPDFRGGKGPAGVGTGPQGTVFAAGATGGEDKHTLSVAEIPPHSHPSAVDNSAGSTGQTSKKGSGNAAAWLIGARGDEVAGGGAAHNNMQPWFACNWILPLV